MCERILEALATDLKEPGDLLPMFGPRIARGGARLLIAERRTMGVLAQRTMLALVSNGVKAHRKGCAPCGCNLHEFRILEGQVGLESHRHPAVVEPAAVGSAAFRDVHEHA